MPTQTGERGFADEQLTGVEYAREELVERTKSVSNLYDTVAEQQVFLTALIADLQAYHDGL